MTPRQFYFLVKRHEERFMAKWRHTSAMMALYANCHRNPEVRTTPFAPEEFMPRPKAAAEQPATDAQQPRPSLGPEVFAAFEKTFTT